MPNNRSSKSNRFIRKKKKERQAVSKEAKKNVQERSIDSLLRLNKFIAHSGFCSRRDADELIKNGDVLVNDKFITEMGYKVQPTDKVVVKGQKISLENFVYLILHKPKNTITTTNDEKDRKTVMSLVEDATGQRVYPVGRLDRNTTGLLLMTNDGDLAHRLMHPSYHIKKTYELQTARPMSQADLVQIKEGVELEDGLAKAYNLKYSVDHPNTIILTIHEGRNRQIRRMAEVLGHEVIKLKRIQYAGLNLKGIRSGRWRNLRQKEVNILRKLVKLEPLDFGKSKFDQNFDD
jgi:23S rRNA pseudouridine2605 synthase